VRLELMNRHAHRFGLLLLVIGGVFAASQGSACSVAMDDRNSRVEVAEDGSFEQAGEFDWWSGQPVRDVGNGVVAQRQRDGGCAVTEILLLVDCPTGRAVDVFGAYDPDLPELAGFYFRGLDAILAPTGPLTIRRGDSFDQIVRSAQSLDITVEGTLNNYHGIPSWDRPDPFFGCKLFYPDSAGALR
jgi:hypothetical protein